MGKTYLFLRRTVTSKSIRYPASYTYMAHTWQLLSHLLAGNLRGKIVDEPLMKWNDDFTEKDFFCLSWQILFRANCHLRDEVWRQWWVRRVVNNIVSKGNEVQFSFKVISVNSTLFSRRWMKLRVTRDFKISYHFIHEQELGTQNAVRMYLQNFPQWVLNRVDFSALAYPSAPYFWYKRYNLSLPVVYDRQQ